MKTLKRNAIRFALILFAIVAIVAVFALIPKARAQMVCGDRTKIVKGLEDGYSEQRTGAGLSGNGALVELFIAETRTWTLLLTLPGGPTCLLGSGEEWEGFKPEKLPGKRMSY